MKKTILSVFVVILLICNIALVPANAVNVQTASTEEIAVSINQKTSEKPLFYDFNVPTELEYKVSICYSSLGDKISSNNIHIGIDTKTQAECTNFEIPKFK